MKPENTLVLVLTCVMSIALVGCGGSGSAAATSSQSVPPAQAIPNFVRLQSDSGDYIGQGQTREYTNQNASISATAAGGLMTLSVNGNETWTGSFQVPNTLSQLQTGTYDNLGRYPFHNPTTGGLTWSGEGRGCNTLQGWFAIDSVTYTNGNLTAIDLRFEQHCEGNTPALRGQIHWTSSDSTQPPGPVNPPPGLWQPAPGVTPASGNYVYLQSDSGDYIGQGQTHTYTQAISTITVDATGGHLSVNISGNERWNGDFQTMSSLSQLQPGYFANLERYPFHNPVAGGLSWYGEGRGCNTLTGWFVVDSVTYTNGVLTAIDLRFEQHCEGNVAALRGKIHWTSNDPTAPSGPVNPPPANLWQPASGVTPASGNYIYLASDAGDYIGQGQTYIYSPANATVSVNASGGYLSVSVSGSVSWYGNFQAMNTLSQLQPGYYANLQRYPFHNPATGGLSWYGQGRGCNTLTGWFVVDSVTYTNGNLTAIDLRFEQHCEGSSPALRGRIRWVN